MERRPGCLVFGFGYRNNPEKAGSERHCGHRGWHGSACGSAVPQSSSEVVMPQLGYQLIDFLVLGREKTHFNSKVTSNIKMTKRKDLFRRHEPRLFIYPIDSFP